MNEEAVLDLVSAYQRALTAGETQLTSIDKHILVACIAESARSAHHRLVTRVAGGGAFVGPLRQFVEEVTKEDAIGNLSGALAQWSTKTAWDAFQDVLKGLVGGTVGGVFALALGLWAKLGGLGEAVADAIGVFGRSTGQWVALVITGAVPSTALFYLLRHLTRGEVWKGLMDAIANLWSRAAEIGTHAESVFRQEVGPAEHALFGAAVSSASSATPKQIRLLAKTMIVITLGCLAIACLLFMLSAIDGFNAVMHPPVRLSVTALVCNLPLKRSRRGELFQGGSQ